MKKEKMMDTTEELITSLAKFIEECSRKKLDDENLGKMLEAAEDLISIIQLKWSRKK